jgi:hypothetical protein
MGMLTGDLWDELFPDRDWPGMRAALNVMGEEIRALRLLNNAVVTAVPDEQNRNYTQDERIERLEAFMNMAVGHFECAKRMYGECCIDLERARHEVRETRKLQGTL